VQVIGEMVSEDSKTNTNNCIKLDVVTPDQLVFSDLVDYVTVPGIIGELGILPHHCPLITILQPGELRIKKDNEEICIAVGGGFVEVRPDRVIVLADAAEKDELIIEQKVQEAIERAKQASFNTQLSKDDKAAVESSLRFELARLKTLEKHKKKKKKLPENFQP
jgi:F-type H+-transporting ATPase subunit epsilon